MKWAKLLLRNQRGQSAVEFALALPVFLLTLIGIMDFGLGIYYYNTVSQLAREGARAAVVLQSSSDWSTPGNAPGVYTSIGTYAGTNTIVGRIAAQAGALDPNSTTVTISAPDGTSLNLNLPVSVEVDYPFSPVLAHWLGIASTIDLSSQATMRIE